MIHKKHVRYKFARATVYQPIFVSLNITAGAFRENRFTHFMIHYEIRIDRNNSGFFVNPYYWASARAYIKDPDNIQLNDIGTAVSLTVVTNRAQYITECNVQSATQQ